MSTPTTTQLTAQQLADLFARVQTANSVQMGQGGEKPMMLRPFSDWVSIKLLIPSSQPGILKDSWLRLSVWTPSGPGLSYRLADFEGSKITVLFGNGRLTGVDLADGQPFTVDLSAGVQVNPGQTRDPQLEVASGICILLTEAKDGGPGGEPQTKDN